MPVGKLEMIVDEAEQFVSEAPERERTTKDIGEHIMQKLKKLDKVAYVRFASVYLDFKDVKEFMDELKVSAERSREEIIPLRLPDACRKFLDRAKSEVFVELHGGSVHAGDRERKRFVAPAAQRLNGAFHQGAADAVALIAGHHADLRGVAHSFGDGGGEHHADGAVARRGTHQERSFGQKLAAAGQQHDIAQKFHAAGFAAVLIVDLAVHVIGIGQLDQPRGGFECTVGPRFEAQAARKRLAAEPRFGESQQHELPRVQVEILREEIRDRARCRRASAALRRAPGAESRAAPSPFR